MISDWSQKCGYLIIWSNPMPLLCFTQKQADCFWIGKGHLYVVVINLKREDCGGERIGLVDSESCEVSFMRHENDKAVPMKKRNIYFWTHKGATCDIQLIRLQEKYILCMHKTSSSYDIKVMYVCACACCSLAPRRSWHCVNRQQSDCYAKAAKGVQGTGLLLCACSAKTSSHGEMIERIAPSTLTQSKI